MSNFRPKKPELGLVGLLFCASLLSFVSRPEQDNQTQTAAQTPQATQFFSTLVDLGLLETVDYERDVRSLGLHRMTSEILQNHQINRSPGIISSSKQVGLFNLWIRENESIHLFSSAEGSAVRCPAYIIVVEVTRPTTWYPVSLAEMVERPLSFRLLSLTTFRQKVNSRMKLW